MESQDNERDFEQEKAAELSASVSHLADAGKETDAAGKTAHTGGGSEEGGGRQPEGAGMEAAIPDDLVESILKETRAKLPVHSGKGGGVVATPARSASTIQEAGEILRSMLILNHRQIR